MMRWLMLALMLVIAGCSSAPPAVQDPSLVNALIVDDARCEACVPIHNVLVLLQQDGIPFGDVRTIQYDSKEGLELIRIHRIERVPTLLLSKNIYNYPAIRSFLADEVAINGYYTIGGQPPFFDISSGAVRGLVNISYLVDRTCKECFDPELLKQPLGNLGLDFVGQRTVYTDTELGQALISAYNITLVPTMVMTGDVFAYPRLMQAWPQVGTIEPDGLFVFRNLGFVNPPVPFKNLTSGTLVRP
jgi:hypothetical protein